jgi:hypothetical protein
MPSRIAEWFLYQKYIKFSKTDTSRSRLRSDLPNCEIGVGIGIQRLRKFLTVNHIVMATDYPHFDSGYTARCPDSTAAGSPGIDLQRRENCVTTFVIGV